jgi:CxxC-x17-CxxC domain-containing protein
MSYADKTLNCKDCGAPFVFTAGEQEFYAQKGFTNEPTRCGPCRQTRKSQMNSRDGMGGGYRDRGNSGPREQFTTTCAGCGKEATVPFVPRNNKPVYCEDCFQSQKRSY